MTTLRDALLFILGLIMVYATIASAVRVIILPRAAPDKLARMLFRIMRRFFDFLLRFRRTYHERDALMALYGPTSVLLLLPFWLTMMLIGYMFMFWATDVRPWGAAFTLSGSSLLTLGFSTGDSFLHTVMAFTEATLGLILVALLIAYLPTMYNAFSRRELAVTLLEIRAGTPPTAVEMLLRFTRLQRIDEMHNLWLQWESWFAEVEESHTSLAALVFFRSPQPDHSWVIASGAVLDAAALAASTLDLPRDAQADLCIRAGYLALRRIADFFGVQYNHDPVFPDDPISVNRAEFDTAYDRMAAAGVPLKPDRELAWLNFAGWRVNYDAVLLALCQLTMAPSAPWSADRAPE